MKKYGLAFGLFVLCLVMFLPGIFNIPTMDRDEALYAQATKQMVQTHDYSQIKFQEKARHLKPPGIYWLQALSVKAFSSANSRAMWPYRLVSVAGATIAVLALFFLFSEFIGLGVAALAAAFMATAMLTTIEVHIANTDSVLLACMVLMQAGLFRAYQQWKDQQPLSRGAFALFWVAMAVGILIKGITPLVGLLTLFALMLFDRSFRFGKFIRPVWGVALVLIITLGWLLPVSLAGHSNFLWDMISGDVLPKLAGGQQSHGAPPGFYLLLLPLMLLPASLFLPAAYKQALIDFKTPVIRFCVAWILPTWIVFACVPTKLPQYVWPLYPAIALLAAKALLNDLSYRSRWRYLAAAYEVLWLFYIFALSVLLIVYPHRINGVYNLVSIIAASWLLLSGIVVWMLYRAKRVKSCIVMLILMPALSLPLIFGYVVPNLKPMWLTEKAMTRLESTGAIKSISNAQPLLATGYTEPSLVFALGTHHVKFLGLNALVSALMEGHGRVALLLEKQMPHFKPLARQAGLTYHIVSEAYGFRYNGGHWQTIIIIERNSK